MAQRGFAIEQSSSNPLVNKRNKITRVLEKVASFRVIACARLSDVEWHTEAILGFEGGFLRGAWGQSSREGAEIRRAFWRLVRLFHPDQYQDPAFAIRTDPDLSILRRPACLDGLPDSFQQRVLTAGESQ